MRPECQVKQFVACVQGKHARFNVYRTGDDHYYLFDMLDPQGRSTTISFPVLKSRLQPHVRRALAKGVGNG